MWPVVALVLGTWTCWKFRNRRPVLHLVGIGFLAIVLAAFTVGWVPGVLLNRLTGFACGLYLFGNILLFSQFYSELRELNLQEQKAWDALLQTMSRIQSAAVEMAGGSRKGEVCLADTTPLDDLQAVQDSVRKVTYETVAVALVCLAVPVIMIGMMLTRIA